MAATPGLVVHQHCQKTRWEKSILISLLQSRCGNSLKRIQFHLSLKGFPTLDSDTSLENLGTTGTKWVALLVTWYQVTATSTTIYRDIERTPDDAGLIRAINKIHSLGMKVMLKPRVDVSNGTWRGQIEPIDWNAWFESYRNFINYYATFALPYDTSYFFGRSFELKENKWERIQKGEFFVWLELE